jgi:hypothetical protein
VFCWRVANGQVTRYVHLTSLAAPMSVATKSL